MRPSLRSLALAALAASLALAPLLAASPAPAADAVTVPDVGGLIWQDAVTALTGAGLVARSAGDGVVVPDASTVADQCPRANASVAAGSTVTLSVRTTIATCASGGGSGGGGPQPVAMWPLDETSGTTANDATGTGHNGAYVGGVALGGPGSPKNGNAASTFTGGGVSVPYSADLNPGAYTVEAWVNPSSVNTYMDQGTAARPIACPRDAQGLRGYMLYADNYTGTPQFAFVVGAGSSRRYVYDNSGVAEQPGLWYHVVGSFDGTDLHLYVNGVEVTSAQLNDGDGTDIQPLADSSFPFQIGMCNGGSAPWNGAIQDLTFWNGALDAATIAQHASAGTPPPGGGGGGGGGCDPSDVRCVQGAGPTVPLVFLPGITGSRLTSCGGVEVWPAAILNNDLIPDLAFHPDGSGTCLQATSVIDSYAGSHFYDKTVDALVRLGGYQLDKTLFLCPFDWRNSASVNQVNLFNVCLSNALAVSGAPEVDVLAHSQGGLVASELVLHNQGAVRRLVTVATPVLGAEKALDVLEWAHECIVTKILKGLFCLPIDKVAAQQALGTMPGYFELLPSPAYAAAVGRQPLLLLGKSSTAYSTLEDYVAQKYAPWMLANAALTHAELDDFIPSVPMLRIVGDHMSTLVQVKEVTHKICPRSGCVLVPSFDFISSTDGDGTVPLNSADLKNDRTGFDRSHGVPNRYFSHNHMGLIQSDDSIKAAIDFFQARTVASPKITRRVASPSTASSVVLPADMPGSDTPTPPTEAVQVEVFGAASTTLESLAGGLLGDGLDGIDGIDGGAYGHADGTDSFTLDTPGAYTAMVQPSDTNPLLVLVRRYSDVVEQQSLFSVPAPVPGQALTLPLTTDENLGDLRLDVNGTQLAPIATTNGDDTEDATPPTTAAGGSVSAWGRTTVTLAADDGGGAGVAATYFQRDGATSPTLYTRPFQAPLFSSLNYWSIDKAGNTEDVHTIVVDDTPDVRQLATPLAADRQVERTIWPAGDEDWFRFSTDGSSRVSAQVDGLLPHVGLDLYDNAGNLVQAPHGSPFDHDEIRGVLAAGTYYLRVTGQARRLLPYVLRLRMQHR